MAVELFNAMTTLKDRNKCPPNGFKFVQPQTGWGEGQTWWDFEALVKDLYNHRLANPRFNLSLDLNQIRSEVDTTNALRCLSIRSGDIYVVQDSSTVPKYMPPNAVRAGVAGAVAKGSALAAGVGTIGAWLGKGGKPVDNFLANARAFVCSKCPQNGKGGLERYFTIPAAALIKKDIERRNSMKLSTPYDKELGVCEACLCPLHLKVHTPLVDIVEHMPEDVKNALDPNCWILHEQPTQSV